MFVVSTSTLKPVSERGGYVKKVVKINRILMATLSHPYIGTDFNDFREVRRHLKELLEMACTMR